MLSTIKSKLQRDSNFKELLSGSAITFFYKIAGMALAYVVLYLIKQKNGLDGVGYYSLINRTLLIVGIFAAMGTNTSILRYLGQYNNKHDRGQLPSLFGNSLKIILIISLILGACMMAFGDPIALYLFREPEYGLAIATIGLTLPLYSLNLLCIEFIRGMKLLKLSELFRSVVQPFVLICSLFIVWQEEIPNIYIIYFFCGAIALNTILSTSVVLRHLLKIKKLHKSDSKISVVEIGKTSAPMMISAIVGTLMGALSIFLLEFYSTTKEVGAFSVIFRISQLITIVLIVVNTISAPKFSELFWSKQNEKLQVLIRQSTKMMFWGSLLLGLFLVPISPWILGIFDITDQMGLISLYILILGQIINASIGSVGLLLNMSGNQAVLRNSGIISTLLQLGLSLWLIPSYGVLGAAIASSSGIIIWNLFCTLYVKTKLQITTYYFPLIF